MSEQPDAAGNEPAAYDVHAVEEKWRRVWDELDPFRADDDSPREKRYALTMFPYPTGDLHMGHAEVMALHDVIARYWWQQGYDVLNPMGWDSFGLPAENAAIQQQRAPGDVHLRQHRDAGRVVQQLRRSASTGRAGCTPPTRSTTAGPSGCS